MKQSVARALDSLLTAPRFGPLAHRVYDLVTRMATDRPQIRNTGILGPKLMRGAQPTPRGFEALQADGVATVVNLRPESDWEEPVVRNCGMAYHKLAVSVMGSPTVEQALEFLAVVSAPATGLCFVHCFHGSDRTGAMCAVYRIAADGWSVADALAEMHAFGFHDGYQDTKLRFVHDFAAYWEDLPASERTAILGACIP